MATLYTPMQMQDMLGVSATGLRIYTTTYPDQLSTEATGKRRKFTEGDLCFLSYVKTRTDAGDNHREVLASLKTEDGKAQWQQFQDEWEAPESPVEAMEEQSTALVPIAAVQAATALMRDAQRREEEAREQAQVLRDEAAQRERELQEQINQLLRELGKTEGELAALKASKPKGFWARLLGGGE